MNVGEQLRSLTEVSPSGDLETGQALYRRGRRRLARRRAAMATGGLAALAVVVAIAAPTLLSPSGPVIDDSFIEQPDVPAPGEPVAPDPQSEEEDGADDPAATSDSEPDADAEDLDAAADGPGDDERVSTEAQIGEATLTIPEAFTVQPTAPDDPTPCLRGHERPTFFLAPDGAPGIPDGECPESGPTAPSVLVTTATTVPPAWLPGEGQEAMTAEWVDIELDGVEAQRATDPNLPGLLVIRSITLDFYLEVMDGDLDPELISDLLDSIRRRD